MSALPKLDFAVNQDTYSETGYKLESVFLSDNKNLIVKFVENQRRYVQELPIQRLENILASTDTVDDVNLLSLLISDQHLKRIDGLVKDKTAFGEFLQTYGRLRLKQGKEISGQRMLESYQNVEMLGFKFSPKHFWIFVFVFQSVLLLSSVIHIRSAVDRKEEESTSFGLNYVIGNDIVRIILWCVLPTLSMLLVYSQQHWTFFTSIFYCAAIVILVSLGIMSYLLSKYTK